MAKSESQKVKTLFVAKYVLENSDENHLITAGDIVDYLKEERGIELQRIETAIQNHAQII